MRTFWRELKFGLRLVRKSPGASLLAMLALGLGIGANTAMFSVANGLLLHPLPFPSLDRLVSISEVGPHRPPTSNVNVAPPNYLDWQQQAQSFAALGAYQGDQMNLGANGTPQMAQGFLVTANFFDLIGVSPLRGRTFLPAEAQPGHDHEVILSEALWRRQFAGAPGILGQTVALDTMPYTVVGIMPDDRVFPQNAALWMPLAFSAAARVDRTDHRLQVVGRLQPGVSLAAASSELQAINQRLDAQYPQTSRGWGIHPQTLAERIVGTETRQYITLLLGAVGFVLLIACANVANLQFARALGRNHELAVRTALGAGRWRLVRQMLTENVLLGLGGSLFGLAFAWVSIRLILAGMPADVAQFIGGWTSIKLDPTALAFTFVIAVGAGVLSGLAPAWHASRPNLNATLKEGGRGTTVGRSRQLLRATLVVAQVALALILLVGAGLMVNGFRALMHNGVEYDPATLLTTDTNLPGTPQYQDAATRIHFYDQVLGGLGALPGVQSVALGTALPLADNYDMIAFSLEGRPVADASAQRLAVSLAVSDQFFSTLRLPRLAGRSFTPSDGRDTAPVVMVSQRLAEMDWPGQSALGQHLKVGNDASPNPWLTIIGVVADVQYDANDRDPEPVIYRDYQQFPTGSTYFLLRGSGGDVTALALPARRVVAALDANQPLFDLKTLAQVIHEANIGLAYVGVMMAVAGVLALLLAGVGVYGVMSFMVRERVHEIGIRRSLGASDRDVMTLILGRGGVLLSLGLLIGFPAAFFLARLLASLIYGVSASDPATYAAIGGLMIVITGLACLLPARLATRVDPIIALREP